MTTKSKVVTGLVIGLAVTGIGYYFYSKNKKEREKKIAEVLKNIGGSAEFDKMNVIQKKALAESNGMSLEELQKSINAQF